jgi:hypothetical protein
MKKGCFISLVILGACVGGYWYVLHPHVEPPAVWWAVGIATLFMWISSGALTTAAIAARDAAKVSGDSTFAGYSGEQFEDGATVTVLGHIRAVGLTLAAPFSGKPAVLYSYDINHISQGRHEANNVQDFSGYALTPCAIDSPHGSVRLLGFPLLEGFDKTNFDTEDGRRNATAYLESTQFTDMEGFHPGAIYHEVKELLTDEDGQLRKDWKMTEDRDLSDKHLQEQLVASGEQVCAIGVWSAAKRGLVPSGMNVTRLLRGDPQQVISTLRGKVVANVIGGLIAAAIANGGVYMLLQVAAGKSTMFQSTPLAQHSIHRDEMEEAVRNGNIPTAERLVQNGTGVDVRDSDGRTPLARVQDAAMARWLIAHGADVNAARPDGQTVLMEQADAGNADIVKILVNAGAKLDTVSSKWHTTALQRALDAEKLDIVRILHDAGAKDETITETKGQALRDDDPPVRACLAYLDAIQREDLNAMLKLSTFKSFDDVDFKVWKASRPAHPKLVSGHATEDAATIELRGAIPSGVYTTWTYQLVRRGAEWRVNNELWETRLSSNEP